MGSSSSKPQNIPIPTPFTKTIHLPPLWSQNFSFDITIDIKPVDPTQASILSAIANIKTSTEATPPI